MPDPQTPAPAALPRPPSHPQPGRVTTPAGFQGDEFRRKVKAAQAEVERRAHQAQDRTAQGAAAVTGRGWPQAAARARTGRCGVTLDQLRVAIRRTLRSYGIVAGADPRRACQHRRPPRRGRGRSGSRGNDLALARGPGAQSHGPERYRPPGRDSTSDTGARRAPSPCGMGADHHCAARGDHRH
jgi:hypothetical protein